MFQKLNAHLLIMLFVALFSYESLELFIGEKYEFQDISSSIIELEEEGNSSEESKKEKEKENELEKDLFLYSQTSLINSITEISVKNINKIFDASNYSSKIYCPPEHA